MDTTPIRVLLIEDNPVDTLLIQQLLIDVPDSPFALECSDRLAVGLERLTLGGIDVVVLDLTLPDSEGLATFLQARDQSPPDVPIVVLTGLDNEKLALEAVQAGAEDYLVKGQVAGNALVRSIRYAIERARRREAEAIVVADKEEFRTARAIQQKFFPTVPLLTSIDIAGMSYCAESTCGDYFDFIRMPDGSVGIVIADVSGHNLASGFLMASTRAYVRALARTHTDPGEILTIVNHALAEDIKGDHFVTLTLVRLDPQTRSFTYASAGHPPGYILDPAGAVKGRMDSPSMPLGIFPEGDFPSSDPLTLEPGDLVLFFTDGIVEARSPDNTAFGTQRALDITRVYRRDPAFLIVDNLYNAVRAFSQQLPQRDDITVVVLKVGVPAPPNPLD